jgi:TPR repeat protein
MTKFYTLAGILSLSEEEKELIEKQALEGDPVACYKLAEIYLNLHESDDYVSSAHELLQKASNGGVADADAEIAIMMFRAEIEPFNPVAAVNLLEKAIDNGSSLGIAFQLRNLLYGRFGYKQNPDLVKRTLKELLSQGEDPYWCAFMGDVLMAEGKIVESQQWYEKAVAGGENSAYGDLALARGMDDEGNFRDYQAYCDTLMEGTDAMDPMCMYYFILDKIFSYDDIDPDDTDSRNECRQLIIRGLELNIEWSHPMSMELLGDIYREGKIDVPVDLVRAWEYYVQGSEFMLDSCFEKMYDMLQANEIQVGQMNNEEAMDLCMVNGARLHNARLLVATVEAYRHGRLTRFAREIEMFHIPAYDAIPDDEPLDDEDEGPDDDGRYDPWA